MLVNDLLAKVCFTGVKILDIGGNKGQSIDKFLHINPNCYIHCYEPNKQLYSHLSTQYSQNINVLIKNFAVLGNSADFVIENEKVRLHICTKNSTISTISTDFISKTINNAYFNKFTYDTHYMTAYKSIKDVLSLKCDIIKIDTEGCEVNILKSMISADVLAVDLPNTYIFEYTSELKYDYIMLVDEYIRYYNKHNKSLLFYFNNPENDLLSPCIKGFNMIDWIKNTPNDNFWGDIYMLVV